MFAFVFRFLGLSSAFLLFALASNGQGASPAAPATTWTLTLAPTAAGGYALTPVSGISSTIANAITGPTTVVINCTGTGLSCLDVTLVLSSAGTTPLTPISGAAIGTTSYNLSPADVPTSTLAAPATLIFGLKAVAGVTGVAGVVGPPAVPAVTAVVAK